MSGFTYASVIIADADVAAAKEHFGEGYFSVPLSTDGVAPATHWMGSGPWDNTELDYVVNESNWSVKMRFGADWQAALGAFNLKVIVPEPVVETIEE